MVDELWAAEHLPPQAAAEFQPGTLEAKFVAPPFSVLDTRQGYWQERRRAWLSLGIKSELGRGADLLSLSPAEEARSRWAGDVRERIGADKTSGSWARGGAAKSAASVARRAAMERQNAPGYRAQAGLRSGEGRELVPGKGNARTDYGAYGTSDGRTSMGAGAASTGGKAMRGSLGHQHNKAAGEPMREDLMASDRYDATKTDDDTVAGGTSIFDPVLCELMYRWFAPEGGLVLDPFAGGSVRGIVAAKLGHPYTGIDLALAQLEANRRQAELILAPTEPHPSWLHGDSRGMDDLLPAGQLYDMVMTCPPYYDLEVYSDDPADLSAMAEYTGFLEGYAEVIRRAALRLRDERFMVLVVSEIRDPAGYCRGFVPDTIRAAQAAGLHLYNEAVLVNSAGSLPLRVTKYMEASRKLGRAHQNVLCFLKGKSPRGWSYDRAAPPSPQLGLGLEPEPVASPPPLAAAVPEAPAPAPVGPEPDTEAPGPFIAGNPDAVPEPDVMGAAVWEAAVAAEAHQAEALRQLDDGRWADPATGELFRDEGGAPGDPVPPLVAPAPAPLPERAMLTNPGNEWRCAGCGSAPSGPLASTVMEGMARGDCDNCGTEKVYRRLQ